MEKPPFGQDAFYFDNDKLKKLSPGLKYKLEMWDNDFKKEVMQIVMSEGMGVFMAASNAFTKQNKVFYYQETNHHN